ncbi:P-loop containing nucleoside triphosphate hydrolase protein [Dendrothele bispora CBS 962.96]|uniref:P-loop containing nucleoside triphosphate hydrolase protein n=1 Tax=Dendrothele bispora (strain CBS 962.96) TaxID=1314807 RepID=A0A4S8MD11_DENBC|nr:P-loop containing nucleoside triphosphate hydrolase protein [Dendrothele bispora CBS 962.96]
MSTLIASNTCLGHHHHDKDVELQALHSVDIVTQSVAESEPVGLSTLVYRHLSYEVTSKAGPKKKLVDDVSVNVKAGELLAIMGPSGAGKSTLLDLMAFRKPALPGAEVLLNGQSIDAQSMFKISSFVEQDDTLLGVLTVRETVTYALRLHSPLLSRKEITDRVDRVLTALGLRGCMNQKIGTPIARGISGGQKRRVTAACAMVTFPRVLLLDEVTSGLDSTSAREVMASIRELAVAEGMMVIATIHQPSLETLAQFTNLILLSEGKICFSGKVDELEGFFERWGKPVNKFTTPVEHAMNFLNQDFSTDSAAIGQGESSSNPDSAMEFRQFYLSTLRSRSSFITSSTTEDVDPGADADADAETNTPKKAFFAIAKDSSDLSAEGNWIQRLFWNTIVLSERTALNYTRNLLAYGVRAGMYAGMGVMLALIWIKLGDKDSTINDRLSVHFYSVAFLAFMSVAGIPSFLEERAVFLRETKNGLYTTLPFLLSNTIVNAPFLLLCVVLFSVICYWAIGLHSGAAAFFRFLAFLYLAILAAESQVLIVAALMPIFVAALAIGAFMNGFWMSVGGYFIKARSLPRFWYYSFHYMDYQRYAFELLTNSDLRGLTFRCVNDCTCAYPSSAPPESCMVSGDDVLKYLDIRSIKYAEWIAVLVGINVIYRVM